MKKIVYTFIAIVLAGALDSCSIQVHEAITHVSSCTNNNTGAIDLNVVLGGGWSSCTPLYSWSNGANTQDISGLSAGTYAVAIDVACNAYSIRAYDNQYDVLFTPTWVTTPTVVNLGNGGLQKATNSGYNINSKGYANNLIAGSSNYDYIEFNVDDHLAPTDMGAAALGLDASPAHLNVWDIDYALIFARIELSGTLYRYVIFQYFNGTQRMDLFLSLYQNGDKFKILKKLNGIDVYQNNSLLYHLSQNITTSLYANASFISPEFEFNPIHTTFGCANSTLYGALNRKLDGSYYIAERDLNFKYDGEYNNGLLNYKVFDMERNVVMQSSTYQVQKTYGDNRLSIPLQAANLTAQRFYVLEVLNEKNESFYLRFYCKGVQ